MIKIRPYLKKSDGKLMFYINNTANGVSVGVGEKLLTSKLTAGQKKLWGEFLAKLKTTPTEITNFQELETHGEAWNRLDFDFRIYWTDICNIAGNRVSMDGAYIAYNGKLYNFCEFNND